jgi:hypothetical protein
MNSPAKRWQSIRKDQGLEVGLVQVDIGSHNKQYDHFTDLVLKQAKDVLKDALVTSAEHHGGKILSWEDDRGIFVFLIEGPDSINNCCTAAMEMLEQLPSVKREVQLPADLERLVMVRISCDIGTATYNAEAHNFAGQFVDKIKKFEQAMSVENRVTITERMFRQLNGSSKAQFVKWKHSPELGVDLFATPAEPTGLDIALADLTTEQVTSEEDHPTRGGPVPSRWKEHSTAQRLLEVVSEKLRSRKMLSISAVILSVLLLFGLLLFLARPKSTLPASSQQSSSWGEMVQSAEWRDWREQIHEKLSTGKVTEKTIAEALNVKHPHRPENAPGALRRDQAIAEVLMTYPDVKRILKTRFGIYEDSFLGTGLSKPFGESNYGATSVHEYLIRNLPDNHPSVWMRILDPNNPQDMTGTVRELFENDPKADARLRQLAAGIAQRVKEKDMVSPAVIRFASLNANVYSRRLGRPEAYLVFASNLSEVWELRVKDAARLSGHLSGRTASNGESFYVWAFLPNHADQVVPATWGKVLDNMPAWLAEIDAN